MPNPHPKQTPEFKAKIFQPISDITPGTLAKSPLSVKVTQEIHDYVMAMPQKERIEFLRAAITDAVLAQKNSSKTS